MDGHSPCDAEVRIWTLRPLLFAAFLCLVLQGVLVGVALAQAEPAYCNGEPYDPFTQGCCETASGAVIYNLSSACCCTCCSSLDTTGPCEEDVDSEG